MHCIERKRKNSNNVTVYHFHLTVIFPTVYMQQEETEYTSKHTKISIIVNLPKIIAITGEKCSILFNRSIQLCYFHSDVTDQVIPHLKTGYHGYKLIQLQNSFWSSRFSPYIFSYLYDFIKCIEACVQNIKNNHVTHIL